MGTRNENRLDLSFAWFTATQFLGALNDHLFRWLMLFLLIATLGSERSDAVSQSIAAMFVLPFLLFTPMAGRLADRYVKRDLIVLAAGADLLIMLGGCAAFAAGYPNGLYAVLFLTCAQSAFFGPSKYGIIPELVEHHNLSRANGIITGLTYLAVVLGTVGAALLVQGFGRHYAIAAIACVAVSAAGLIAGLMIRPTPKGACDGAILSWKGLANPIAVIRKDRDLGLAVLASGYFNLLAGLFQIALIPYGIRHLGLPPHQSGYLFLVTAIGIAIGSYLAGHLSARAVEVGLIPVGAIGLFATSVALAWVPAGHVTEALFYIALMGMSGGLFVVPVSALIQWLSPQSIRGQVLAASNLLGWVGVLASAGLSWLLTYRFGLSSTGVFLSAGILTLLLAMVTLWRLPDFFVRFIIVVLVRSVYRIKVKGEENVPTQGPALLAANHVGWLDAFLLGATQQRRIRFIMSREIFQKSAFRPIFRLMRVILISSNDPPKQIIQSLRQARQALDEGQLVCIFPEGVITRNGMVQGFRGGLERILRGSDYPLIPVYIGGAWGSIFSYSRGRIGGLPKRIPYPISIHFGKSMPASSEAWQIRQRVMELSTDFFNDRALIRRPLGGLFIQTARRHWHRPCVSDVTGRHLTYGQTLTAAVLLARRITDKTGPTPRIGVLLPPSVAAAVTHVALALLRGVSVNLNYTASTQAREAALRQCQVKHIVTSRAFLARLGIDPAQCGYLFVEDLLGSISRIDKAAAWLKARLWPWQRLCHTKGFQGNDAAAILLSSGSTGQAKAVALSHHNIASNLEQMRMIFRITPKDRFCGVLPLFHCFGLTITLWFPLMNGAAVSFIPNPLDGKAVAGCVRKDRCTLLMATPTFLQTYLRRAEPQDMASLRDVIVGAEKLPTDLADRFEQRFGIRPHEGYGATETSPVVSINLPAVEIDGVRQIGTKPGSVGQPLPGIALKVIDPDIGQVLPPGQQGLLWIKGPNVMRGYLNAPDLTVEVLQDQWYNTGDIVTVDEDGFIFITDRLSRFSKIGGEMVPHVQVEQVCSTTLKTPERVLAVTGIPDPTKGEELVVLYVPVKACPERMYEAVAASPLPNLWKPKRRNFVPVESIPILGSGKLDIQQLKRQALEACLGKGSDVA